jgi:hypothetical protein
VTARRDGVAGYRQVWFWTVLHPPTAAQGGRPPPPKGRCAGTAPRLPSRVHGWRLPGAIAAADGGPAGDRRARRGALEAARQPAGGRRTGAPHLLLPLEIGRSDRGGPRPPDGGRERGRRPGRRSVSRNRSVKPGVAGCAGRHPRRPRFGPLNATSNQRCVTSRGWSLMGCPHRSGVSPPPRPYSSNTTSVSDRYRRMALGPGESLPVRGASHADGGEPRVRSQDATPAPCPSWDRKAEVCCPTWTAARGAMKVKDAQRRAWPQRRAKGMGWAACRAASHAVRT